MYDSEPLPVRHDAPAWADLGAAMARGLLRQAVADDWSLALRARGVPHRLLRAGARWRILVPVARLDEAVQELTAYLQEQPVGPPEPEPRPGPLSPAVQAAVAVVGLATAFTVFMAAPHPGLGLYPETWDQAGRADSALILGGQWWRAVTALTLHADAAHFLGNAAIGGLFTALFGRRVGTGTAWALFVATGLAGNVLNAWFHGPGHLSVGASTAVFGVVGAMGAAAMAERRRPDLLRAVAPVAAGLGILAMLGTGGERTDLGAHLFGFLAGLPLGWLAGRRAARRGPARGWWPGLAALGLVALAWSLALATP